MINQGARLRRAWENYASQSVKTHVLQKIVLYFKGVTINTENYNQQSRSLHCRRLQLANPSQGKNHKKGKERRKEKEKRNNGGGGT